MAHVFSRALYVLGFAAFLLIGALQAIYGPAFGALAERFGVPRAEIGLIASAHFLGTMLGVIVGGVALSRAGLRGLLRAGAALLALGLAFVSFAPSWNLALAGALIGGLGFGGVSVTFNVGFARLGTRAAPSLNLLNACFGLGSVLAPLLVAFLAGGVWPFLVLGALAVALLLGAGALPELPDTVPPGGAGRANTALLALFGLLFVVYVGVEAGVGSWMTSHLSGVGVAGAAAWTSAFWLTVTVGRVLSAPLAQRVALPSLVIGAAALAALSLPFAATPLGPFAYLLAGLAIAPLFATSLAWFGQLLPTRLAPVALACGGLGGTLFPALLGFVVGSAGVEVLPFAFAFTALGVVVVALALRSATRREVVARGA